MRVRGRLRIGAAVVVTVSAGLGGPATAAEAKPSAPELVSRASGTSGEVANRFSVEPTVSADGRFVAFTSRASNLDPADTDHAYDVFVHDLASDSTSLVSRTSGESGAKANIYSAQPSLSADGRYVAFNSEADNLVPGVSGPQIYVRDLVEHTTTLVSRGTGPDGPPANGNTSSPSISADGRFVSFVSSTDTFGYAGTGDEVYVRDLVAQTTTLVSVASNGGPAGGRSLGSAISGDGNRVAFVSFALNGGLDESNGTLIVRDLPSATTILASPWRKTKNKPVGTNFYPPSISDDGNRTPFESSAAVLTPKDDSRDRDVFLRDIAAERTSLVSRDFGAERIRGTRDAVRPDISGNGRFVSFTAGRSSLREGGGQRAQGLFVHDVKKRQTIKIPGTPGAGTTDSLFSALSRSGRVLAFSSDSPSLSPADNNDRSDIFVLDPGA